MTIIRSNEVRKVLRVFIASPSGLEAERHCFREIIDEVNRTKANSAGVQLEAHGWEDTLPEFGRPQELINADIEECDLIVMLLWKRWGTPTGEYSSGFEEEYELAKRLREERGGTPAIWLYFRKVSDDMLADMGPQLEKVQKFRTKIVDERSCMYSPYEDEDQWEKLFREHMSRWIDGIPPVALHAEIGIEERMQRKEYEDEIQRLKAELETEKQNSQTAIRSLALTLGIEAIERADSGQITKAEEYFAKSIASYPNPAVINEYGRFLKQIGMLKNAEEKFSQVAEIGKETGNDSFVAIAYCNIGMLYDFRGDLNKAEEMYKKSLAINEVLGQKGRMAKQYGNLGTLYAIRGDFDKAKKLYKKSLAINEELGRNEGMASDYKNLGYLYLTWGILDKAEGMYKKSLAINEELGRNEGMASDYKNLGNLHLARNNLSKAEEMCKKSLAINEKLGQKGVMAGGYSNLGMLYNFRGDLDKAEEMHRKSLAINEELGWKDGMASDYNNLGILYNNRGDLDKAEEMYKKSITVSMKLGQKGVMAIAYDNLGTLYKIRGNLDRAEEMYRKSLELFTSIGSKPMIETLESLIDALKRDD